jgi:gamma-glutamyltranspeptidase
VPPAPRWTSTTWPRPGATIGWVEPLTLDYRGHRVLQLPPNGQGVTLCIALGILSHFDPMRLGSGSAKRSTWRSKR